MLEWFCQCCSAKHGKGEVITNPEGCLLAATCTTMSSQGDTARPAEGNGSSVAPLHGASPPLLTALPAGPAAAVGPASTTQAPRVVFVHICVTERSLLLAPGCLERKLPGKQVGGRVSASAAVLRHWLCASPTHCHGTAGIQK